MKVYCARYYQATAPGEGTYFGFATQAQGGQEAANAALKAVAANAGLSPHTGDFDSKGGKSRSYEHYRTLVDLTYNGPHGEEAHGDVTLADFLDGKSLSL